jgi:drug/metabolite transporter (DMT)-like permease
MLVIIAFGALALWPSMIGQLWGARLVPATRAALLTMTEIVVATGSAALLIGTSLTSVSIIGGLVIVAAVVIDLLCRTMTASGLAGCLAQVRWRG